MNTFYQLLCQTTFFRKNYRRQKKMFDPRNQKYSFRIYSINDLN